MREVCEALAQEREARERPERVQAQEREARERAELELKELREKVRLAEQR
jgi:hypothetical protein